MEKTKGYIVTSLELHLFFARIMKEHSLFLKLGFLPPNGDLAAEAQQLMHQFESLLSRTISLSNHAVRCRVLESGEVFTEFTERAEQQTQRFTGTCLDRSLTRRTRQLCCLRDVEELCCTPRLHQAVRQLNREGIALVDRIIRFKERLLRRVNCCDLFTVNYPLLIEHILREARLYRAHLLELEGMRDCSSQEVAEGELFWDRIMMEHALFIRGLLDPTEELICTANDFAGDYKRLLETSCAANDRMMDTNTLSLTQKFRDFKAAGVKGIENCQIRSIILPLLADHVLREANHYIRLLEDRTTCG